MSSKKSKKQNVKSKSRTTKKPITKSNNKNKKKKASKNTKLPTSHLKVTLNTTKLHSSDDDIVHHRRTKSPLSPFTDWYKSHKKKSKPKSKFNRQRSQSNKFYSSSASKYKRKKSKDKSQPKPHTPRNTESKYKKNRNKSPPEGDHKKQLKFTRKNDKITIDLNHNSKKKMSPKSNKKTKNKRKHIDITPPTNTISISQLSKSTNNSPQKQSNSRKSTSKKKRQSFARRASFKLKKTRSHSANPPNANDRKKSSKRGSFFSISRDKKLKNQNAIREREKKKKSKQKSKKKKSLKERIGRKSKNKNNKEHTIDENMIFTDNDYDNYDNDMHHEARSSLNVHKLRMTAKALREEMDDEYNDDLLGGNTIKLLNDRDDSSSLDNSHTQYTTTIKFKDSDSNSRKGMHHKRGSSGIPHFFQKKLAFELGQYVDEKARLFISYYCRLYGLRITEQLFDIISTFHVMPFDSGFICMTSKDPINDDDKYETFTNVTYHSPLIQTPMALMSGLLGVTDGITDDRLSALLEQEKQYELLKQQSVPIRAQSVPPPVSFRHTSKSFDHVNLRKGMKKVNFAEKTPITQTKKTSSAEYIPTVSLRQSQSNNSYQTDEELFCDDIDIDNISRKKEADLMKIIKYKKKASQKRNKKLKRSTTYDTTKKHKKKIKSKVTPKIFYSSASELSEDEHPSIEDIDLSNEANDGFPDINYTDLLLQNPSDNSVEYSHTLSINKIFKGTTPTLYEDTNTTFNTTTIHTNDTPNTITNNNKVTELCTDYSPPPSPKGYRSDEEMTPRSPTVTNDKFIYSEEFKISFDEHDMQIISNENKINKMKKEWIGTNENINGIGIAEWTILSNPKVFNYHNNPNNKQVVNNMTQHIGIGLGLGLGFGIGGFIDRTRGVCDVSLAPVYYRYGGQDINNGYYDKLDMYNLYTGDYIQSCSKLPFNGLYDTCSSIVREGYKSTLIITGGQYYGQEIFDDNNIQSKTYFYVPWINSNYHHQISEYGLNNGFIDKHNIINTNGNNKNQSRRNSITDITPINNNNSIQENNNNINTKRLSNIINFNNIPTRTSRSISITHSYRSRDDKLKKRTTNTNTSTPSTNLNDIPSLPTYESNTITTSDSSMLTTRKDINIKNKLLGDGNWITGPSMITPRASHGSVSWDEHIIFCCGGIGSTGRRISNVEMLRMDKFKQLEDINKLRWRKCQSMSANKSNLVLIHWKPKTCIVSVGSGSKVVESYDPYKDNWKDLPPLNTHQISSKSCRFYYDTQSNNNCLIFIKFRNGIVKSMEYLDERKKLKKWTNIKDQYVELFNAQINQSNHNNNQTYLKNIKTFCFS